MLRWYSQILLIKRDTNSYPILLLLLILSVGLPLSIGLVLYDPIITVAAAGAVLVVLGISLFFNVLHFTTFVFPLIFAYTSHYFIFSLSVLTIVSFLAARLRAGHLAIEVPYPRVILLILLTGFMGVVRAYDPDIGRYAFQYNVLLPVVLFIAFYNIKPKSIDIEKIFTMISVIAALIGIVSLSRYFIVGWTRTIVGWVSTNPAACFFSMILPFSIVAVIDSKNPSERLFRWTILLGIFSGIFVTQSRAAFLVALFSMFYLAWKDRSVLKVMMPVIVAGVVAVPTLVLWRLMLMFGAGGVPDWSSVGRVLVWRNSLILLPDYFLLGMGLDSFRFVYPINFPESFLRAEHPHSVYLRWIFEQGIFGFAAYIAIFFGIARRGFIRIKLAKRGFWTMEERLLLSLNTGFIAALLAALVDSPFHHPQVIIFMWMFVAFQLHLLRKIERKSNE